MIKVDINCIHSLKHLLKDTKEMEARAFELMENDPIIHVVINTIAGELEKYYEKDNTATVGEIAAYAAFLMYNLIRIQIESNELK
ncbi:MAG: hypothetical protein ACFFG0_08155 [Candidatus Thorarchaeota archaeon]